MYRIGEEGARQPTSDTTSLGASGGNGGGSNLPRDDDQSEVIMDEQEEELESDENIENETDLVVLDPDHVSM